MTYWSSSGGGGLEVTLHVLNCHTADLKNRSVVKQMVCFHHRHHFDRHNWEVASDDMHIYAYIHTLYVCMLASVSWIWAMLLYILFDDIHLFRQSKSLWTVIFSFSYTHLSKFPFSHQPVTSDITDSSQHVDRFWKTFFLSPLLWAAAQELWNKTHRKVRDFWVEMHDHSWE